MLPKFYDTIKNDLEILESKLIEYLLTPNKPTNQVLSHIFSSGGKRIRPAIFLLCSQLIDYDGEFKFPIASVCEYIHTASLLHDDVIDNSSLRRNKPTVNSIWGDETAVLSGDLIYSAACRLMVKTRSLELIDDFAECIRFMSESELFQLELLWKKDTSLSDYERVVSGKTAILFQASAKTPCYLKNASQELSTHFANYGKFLGFAFQIFDDCLDYEGNEELLGKPVVTDLLEGKVTLPLIYSLQSENKKLDIIVSSVLENGKISPEDKSKLLLNVKECGGLEKSFNLAEFYSQKARDALNEIAKILKLSEKQKLALDALNQITYFVLNRKN
ncbi:polyprenyl synthetase family protein [Pigmentibacter ruber]|uniref:polyprenyl synthetase family protein n=1 Tax=Pigmentibacter ruber TaxID=2683196 RepID=UPI00131C9158|nr:polyprenyl synthetase family protein [Pigmentibacter ruber]